MAVQQNKKSRSEEGDASLPYDRVAKPTVIYCSCGAPTMPHTVCPSCGQYKGRQVEAAADEQ